MLSRNIWDLNHYNSWQFWIFAVVCASVFRHRNHSNHHKTKTTSIHSYIVVSLMLSRSISSWNHCNSWTFWTFAVRLGCLTATTWRCIRSIAFCICLIPKPIKSFASETWTISVIPTITGKLLSDLANAVCRETNRNVATEVWLAMPNWPIPKVMSLFHLTNQSNHYFRIVQSHL